LTDDAQTRTQTTSQALTDIGRGATFYDNLVDVVFGVNPVFRREALGLRWRRSTAFFALQ